jgi:hypothetical protein
VVSFADTQKLPYLQACIKEALRICGPAPMGLPRTVPAEGVTIGDRTFAPGTILSVNAWVMHHSTEIWGPDAAEFKPQRWLKADAPSFEKYFMPVSRHFDTWVFQPSVLVHNKVATASWLSDCLEETLLRILSANTDNISCSGVKAMLLVQDRTLLRWRCRRFWPR